MAATPTPATARRRLVPARYRKLLVRIVIPVSVAILLAVGAYAYFTSSGVGTGTVPVGTLSAPVVNPPGSPAFNLTGMVGGDTAVSSATVTVNGGLPTVVAIYEENATGALLSQLNLKVVQDGSTTVYNGPLATGWTAASPFTLSGTGAGGLWPVGESHTFVFTVSLPLAVGNAFQAATASLNFVWLREQV